MSRRNLLFSIHVYIQENRPKLSKICKYGIFSKGLNEEFEAAMVRATEVLLYSIYKCVRQFLH